MRYVPKLARAFYFINSPPQGAHILPKKVKAIGSRDSSALLLWVVKERGARQEVSGIIDTQSRPLSGWGFVDICGFPVDSPGFQHLYQILTRWIFHLSHSRPIST